MPTAFLCGKGEIFIFVFENCCCLLFFAVLFVLCVLYGFIGFVCFLLNGMRTGGTNKKCVCVHSRGRPEASGSAKCKVPNANGSANGQSTDCCGVASACHHWDNMPRV